MTLEVPQARMRLERNSGLALWRQIETALAGEISEGGLQPGARLPTEAVLAARFEVNRHTIRRAIAALVARGLLKVEQGRGTFVPDHVLDYLIGRRTRFTELVHRQNRTPGGRLLFARTEGAGPEVARALAIRPDAAVHLLETLGEIDGRPVSVASHYFPAARFPDLLAAYSDEGSITGMLTRFGLGDYERRTTRVTARLPDDVEADLLQQPRTRPVLVTEAVNVDANERPVEFGVTRFAGDRFAIVLQT